ncbi:synemin-like [Conger conger]|uniref:synemin-like n=1 Tax=Conger conger TaxID=82655 RepID=UPI002A5AB689|nr:synemin-like [Conger conger]
MFQFRRTFENEKHQLQELNTRLGQYLSRVKQLEQENAFLAKEINIVRQERTVEWGNQHKAELRELRRTVNQLAFEKSKAEMEREKMWRELQVVQDMYNKETGLCRNFEVEVKGCEKQLHQTIRTNQDLEERLFQLEHEYKSLEDAQQQEIVHVRKQVYSMAMPVPARQNYRATTALTTEEIEQYAQTLSDSWTENFEMYQRKIEELEESIRADEAKFEDLQREKMQYATELKKLQSEAEKQNQLHANLEEQIMNIQDSCHMELEQYQAMMQDLEDERQALAVAIAEKLRDHQELMQVKMGLSLEVAAYRSLLEEESKDVLVWTDQHSRGTSRRIDVKAPAMKRSTVNWQDMKRHPTTSTAYNIRYMEPTSSPRTFSTSGQLKSNITSSATKTVTSRRDHRSPLARRDMLSFASASRHRVASSSPASARPGAEERAVGIQKKTTVHEMVRSKEASQNSARELARDRQAGAAHGSGVASSPKSPGVKPNIEDAVGKSVRVVSPPMMSLVSDTVKEDDNRKVQSVKVIKVEETELKAETTPSKVAASHSRGDAGSSQNLTGGTWRHDGNEPEGGVESPSGIKWDLDEADTGEEMFPEEQKVLHSISMEDIIETVVKPVGLDTKLIASPDSKVTYHVEKMEDEDGTTKTKIILQSKVEEELDMSDESALEELLGHGGKTVSLEDIKGTPTGDMIQNLLSLGLQGGGASLENKSINVEIIEEPVEDQSDEETDENPAAKPFQSSKFFQIEELENESSQLTEGRTEATKASVAAGGYRKVELATFPEGTGGSPYFTQVQEAEYFVSTPDEHASEPEEEGDFSSYGHYGAEDHWLDERYYQKEEKPKTRRGDSSPNGGEFPERIIKEEVRVSPSVQETMLGILKQDTMDTKQQLRGTLEQLHGTVSGPLQEDLDLFMRGDGEGPESLNVRKVQQVSDNGKVTIVAELNVSQTLGDSGPLGEEADMSEEQIMAALRSGDQDLQHAFSTRGGYTVRVSDDNKDGGGYAEESVTEVSRTEKHIKLGPSEKSFTFQMDASDGN